ncbi:MAG: septation protein SpoVG family protein [Elusimicrobia bacterium]|nr:septation protein SpoVG family protein [Elusimicrobiota bacterium]
MEQTVALPSLEARVKLYRAESGQSQLMGFADLVIGGAFVIKGLRILMSKPSAEKPGGLFIGFPSRRGTGEQQDKYFEVAHPITAEARIAVRDLVLQAYQELVAEKQA